MIMYLKDEGDGNYRALYGNPTILSVVGTTRTNLSALKLMTPAEQEDFGVFEVVVNPPEGKQWTGEFEGLLPVYEETPEPSPSDPNPSREDVILERQRRLAAGFDYDFHDSRGVHRIGTTDRDMFGWDEVSKGAAALLALDMPDAKIQVVTATGPVEVSALEWQYVLLAAAAFRQPIWQASFALQVMEPIPMDYSDDSYWP